MDLNHIGIVNMGHITRANEDSLYRLFGIVAELLIDHAWGRETTTMADKNVVTGSMSLMIGYSNELELKPAIGTTSMSVATNSYRAMIPYVMEQYDLFTGPAELEKDRRLQKAGTTIERNRQIGGHKSGE